MQPNKFLIRGIVANCQQTRLARIDQIAPHVKVIDYPQGKTRRLELLADYRHIVALPGETLGQTDLTFHHIALKEGTNPIYVPAYRLPHSQRAVVQDMVQGMLDENVIRHSKSPFNSPLFLVPKKDVDGALS